VNKTVTTGKVSVISGNTGWNTRGHDVQRKWPQGIWVFRFISIERKWEKTCG